MVGSLFQHEDIDAVIVGADRVVKNGDTANKVSCALFIGSHQLLLHNVDHSLYCLDRHVSSSCPCEIAWYSLHGDRPCNDARHANLTWKRVRNLRELSISSIGYKRVNGTRLLRSSVSISNNVHPSKRPSPEVSSSPPQTPPLRHPPTTARHPRHLHRPSFRSRRTLSARART
jgi:methylthioribose-1-phosphate isomerase